MLESNPQQKQKVEQLKNTNSVMKEYGSDARPGAVSVEEPGTCPAPLLMRESELSALSCQYKDNSDTRSKICRAEKGKKHGAEPLENSPVSVVACHNQSWTLKIWKKDDPMEQLNIPFTCRTWRHDGPCRQFKGAQDFVRIREGLQKFTGWVYIVLTYEDRRGSPAAAYKKIADQFENLRRWITRNYCAPGERLQYVALIEQHKDGFPHVNVLLHSTELVRAANDSWKKLRRKIRPRAMATGFGKVFWLEPVRSAEAISGYFVKLCGEVAKMSQAPMKAPSKFRRMRSSKGLLPPVRKDPEYTGELVRLEANKVRHMISYRIALATELGRLEDFDKEHRAMRWYHALECLKDGSTYSPFRLKLFA
jgi:hypothetical protein